MRVTYRVVRLNKRYPLTISRGTSTGSDNLFVFVEDDGFVGVGECAPGAGTSDDLAELARAQLEALSPEIEKLSIVDTWALARTRGIDISALAALDMALWDLFAKRCNQPLYSIFGLSRRSVPTSVTIGINPVEVIRERVPEIIQRTGAKFLKVKLGCSDGIERDKENYETARECANAYGVSLRVDANGGWTVDEAVTMMRWLAERGCDYVEQPLARGQENDLEKIFSNRPLPIYVDESCRLSCDVPKLAPYVDGVNLKLMKCGGLTEAIRIVAVARAHGLSTMIGCMGESSVSISAGASIGSLFDHIDLDSHLNLSPDPAEGAKLIDGVVTPCEMPGHCARLIDA